MFTEYIHMCPVERHHGSVGLCASGIKKKKDITPQFYTWTSGYASVLTNFTYAGGDKWTVTIPAKPSCTKVDFCIALDSTGDPWIKDGGDHSVTFPSGQKGM